jgi:hypothetical protein
MMPPNALALLRSRFARAALSIIGRGSCLLRRFSFD